MRKVFGDTLYWVAISNPRDSWHQAALDVRAALGDCLIVTTDGVLVEYLTALAGQGEFARNLAAATVERLLKNPMILVASQTREVFLQGLMFYKSRSDKAYSLTDCISMNTMREEGILEVLTNDHHFAQEGFTVLIQR